MKAQLPIYNCNILADAANVYIKESGVHGELSLWLHLNRKYYGVATLKGGSYKVFL